MYTSPPSSQAKGLQLPAFAEPVYGAIVVKGFLIDFYAALRSDPAHESIFNEVDDIPPEVVLSTCRLHDRPD